MGHGHPVGCGRREAPGSALASCPRGGQRLLYLPGTPGEGGAGPGGLHPAATHARAGRPLASPGDTAPCTHFSASSGRNPLRPQIGVPMVPSCSNPQQERPSGVERGAQVGNAEPQHRAGWLWERGVVASVSHGMRGRQRWAGGDVPGYSTTLGFPAAPHLDQEGIWSGFLPLVPAGLFHATVPCRAALCAPLLLMPAALSSCSGSPRQTKEKPKKKKNRRKPNPVFLQDFFCPSPPSGNPDFPPQPVPAASCSRGSPGGW